MGLKERREREKKELREKLLSSARCIFAEKGYHFVTIRDIARMTEYSVPTLYSYFKDKESLMLELVKSDITEIQRMALENARKKEGAVEQLKEFGHSSLCYLRSHPEQFKFLFQSFLSNLVEDAIVTPLKDEGDRFILSCFNQIAERELTPVEFLHYRMVFISDIHGILSVIFGKMETCDKMDAERIYEMKWTMFLNFLKLNRGRI